MANARRPMPIVAPSAPFHTQSTEDLDMDMEVRIIVVVILSIGSSSRILLFVLSAHWLLLPSLFPDKS